MAMQQIFKTIDLMMLPTGEPAGKLEPVPHYSLFTDPSYTTAFNVSGNPAFSVCSGFAANGMPQSLQIVGRLFEDATVPLSKQQLAKRRLPAASASIWAADCAMRWLFHRHNRHAAVRSPS
jgi:Asp-tRNA(Asn)/Glu-tRNA(Gln) amidotransferase A subunit family amidase